MQYQFFKIHHFRGISSLEVEDLKQINLLVGRNNCGKTSVLEALFLLSGMSNPQLPINIHHFRDLMLLNDEDFSYMFHHLNFETPIILRGKIDNKNREVTINPLLIDYSPHPKNRQKQQDLNNQQEMLTVSTNIVRLIEGIKLDFKSNQQVFSGQISIKEGNVKLPIEYKEKLRCAYLTPKTIMMHLDKRMEGLLIQKKLSSVIDVLKGIEPKLIDIRMGAGGMIYVDIGAEHLLPLNIMGDGMRRILAILTAIADIKNGVLLIDEIENGLHYKSLNVLWKAVISACKEYNVQLMATTHSYECIEELSNAYIGLEPEGDEIRLFRIDKKEDTHTAYKLNTRSLSAGIEKNFEVR
ncbi:MAG: AAA family ATPase [Desulfobacterales bacterium]|nr:AAA family ATPase [Desulfobacterales bacterium]